MSKRGKWADEAPVTINRDNPSDRKPGERSNVQLNLRISLDLRRRALGTAKFRGVNLSDVVAKFLEDWVKE